MKDLVLESAVRQLELLRLGEISVLELAEEHIRQIQRLNPEINAIVNFDADRVRSQARRLDRQQEMRGTLHGLPVTVKSSIATAGYLCEIGSPRGCRRCRAPPCRGRVDSGHHQLPRIPHGL